MWLFKEDLWKSLSANLFLAGRSAAIVLALTAFVLSAPVAVAGPHPNMYLNQAEIDAIQVKIDAKQEPWLNAYNTVMSAANSALDKFPVSVTFEGNTSNQYYTEKAYCGWSTPPALPGRNGCIDGERNPAQDRKDYESAIELGSSVRDLGLAYAFTGEAKYADKAIEFIRVWSLDANTRMTPTTAAGNRIELFITLPGYFYGADLIWNYDGWVAGEKEAFRSWVKSVGDHAKANGAGVNNFANWRVVLIASVGALLDDNTFLDFAETEWKRLVPIQVKNKGSIVEGQMNQEQGRTRGLHYSLYAINAMIQVAEILRRRGVNLYDYESTDPRASLKLALDFITPFARESCVKNEVIPCSWKATGRKQITTITQDDSMAMYELAYSYYQDPDYLEVINHWGRPMDEIRVMGITTLTHATASDVVVPQIVPVIVTQPEAITVSEGEDATFSVVATGSGSLSYQWLREGSPIPNATQASYTVTAARSSDDGSDYRLEVSNDQGVTVSDEVRLTVQGDEVAPTLISAVAVNNTRVDLTFSEAVSANSAETRTNYQIDFVTISAANLSDEGRTVSLTVSPLSEDTTYTVSVSNVQDLAQSPNTIGALSNITFSYRDADDFEDGNADGWSPLTPGRWEVTQDVDGDQAYWLNTTLFGTLYNGALGEYALLAADYGDFTFNVQARLGDNVDDSPLADYAVVFGYQDEKHYYYVMFNNTPSETQLFKVINGTRTTLAAADSAIDWLNDNAYHRIEVSRAGSTITVRFDGSEILSANDSSLGAGRVGVGSFNDSAYFDDVSVTGDAATGSANRVPSTPSTPKVTLITN